MPVRSRTPEPATVAAFRRPTGGLRAWLRAARVRQWTKNLLVFGAPAAAGALGHADVLARVSIAFAAFCVLASGIYLLNDVHDAAEDRHHPVKRHRPIASGALSPRRAAAVGLCLVLAGIGLSAIDGLLLLAVGVAYAALNLTYTTWLRRVAVADIAVIAAAFVLRGVAGGVAAHVHISRLFLVVVSFGALFVVAGKRYGDYLDPGSRRSRQVLRHYSARSLRLVIVLAAVLAAVAYLLWALFAAHSALSPWRELTIVPFAAVIARYAVVVLRGGGAAPEQVLFSDRLTQLAGAGWLLLFLAGV